MRKKDVYGNIQRWIMTVKDHSTGLVYLCALPRKKAIYVAAELEKYFGLIGYPEIFHTGMFTFSFMLSQKVYFISVLLTVLYISLSDNGKEFIATVIVDLIKKSNPNCYLVTGRPRTPRD
jgi:hypothetical protein